MLNPAALLKFCMYAPELWRDWGNGWDAKAKRHWTSPVESHCSSTPRTGRREFVSCAFTVWHFYIRWIILVETLGKGDNSKIYWRKHFKNEWAWASVMKKLVEKKSGETNLWDKMTNLSFFHGIRQGKTLNLKPNRATRGLMFRLLIIARSSRELDMEVVIANYGFRLQTVRWCSSMDLLTRQH